MRDTLDGDGVGFRPNIALACSGVGGGRSVVVGTWLVGPYGLLPGGGGSGTRCDSSGCC